MSHSEDNIMSPPEPGKETTTTKKFIFLNETKTEKLERLHNQIGFLELVRIILWKVIYVISTAFTWSLLIPVNVIGIPLYSLFQFLILYCFCVLFIVHFYLLPLLIDERRILSYKIKKESYYLPAYHSSNSEMFWYYHEQTRSISMKTVIWIYLSSIDFHVVMESRDKHGKLTTTCLYLGMLLICGFFYALLNLSPLYG